MLLSLSGPHESLACRAFEFIQLIPEDFMPNFYRYCYLVVLGLSVCY